MKEHFAIINIDLRNLLKRSYELHIPVFLLLTLIINFISGCAQGMTEEQEGVIRTSIAQSYATQDSKKTETVLTTTPTPIPKTPTPEGWIAHPTPDKNLQINLPADAVQWTSIDGENEITSGNTVLFNGGSGGIPIYISPSRVDEWRKYLNDNAILNNDTLLFINLTGFSECTGLSDDVQYLRQGEASPIRTSILVLAARYVYPQFVNQNLNNPAVRQEFYNAIASQFRLWVGHEVHHVRQRQEQMEPGDDAEATATSGEYDTLSAPLFFEVRDFYGIKDYKELEMRYRNYLLKDLQGEISEIDSSILDYNGLYRHLMEWAKDYCP
jgi:hypothetical protein